MDTVRVWERAPVHTLCPSQGLAPVHPLCPSQGLSPVHSLCPSKTSLSQNSLLQTTVVKYPDQAELSSQHPDFLLCPHPTTACSSIDPVL